MIRQRVAPFVQAGGRVREVLLPHEAIGRLVALAGWPSACVLSMLTSMACLAVVQDDFIQSAYLAWAPTSAVRGDADRLLARYQLAARMMPHLRRWLASAPDAHVAVCGDFPDLRSAMVPIVEELDREVDVLDAALVGQAWDDRAEPNEIAGRQLAWAVAAGGAR